MFKNKSFFKSIRLLFISFVWYNLALAAESNQCLGFYTPSKSYLLKFEKATKERTDWVNEQSGHTTIKLSLSRNYQTIADAILINNSKPHVIDSRSNKWATYTLEFNSLTEPQYIYKIDKTTNKKELLLSGFDLKHDTSFALINIWATHDNSKLLIAATDNGSLDGYNLYIYDLKTKKAEMITIEHPEILWINTHEFMFESYDEKRGYFQAIFDLKTMQMNKNPHLEYGKIDETSFTLTKHGSTHLYRLEKKPVFIPRNILNTFPSLDSHFEKQNGDLVISVSDPSENKTAVFIKNKAGHWNKLYENKNKTVVESVLFSNEHISIVTYWGSDSNTQLLSYSGMTLAEIKTPECCQISNIKWNLKSNSATVYLSTHFKKNIPFEYSLSDHKFIDPTFRKQMLSYDGIDYQSTIRWAKSQDGTQFPVRLTYRKDLNLDGNNPSLIYGYGGFNSAGYLNAVNNRMDTFFIKNGGIIAGPALRGGNEFGINWNKAAQFSNKYKTMQDFAATSELLQQNGFSGAKKIAIQGWSNGGFVVAATGLMFPDHFGLIVSGNGVNDQYRKEVLDAKFGLGWSFEYGDSRLPEPNLYMEKTSPVYLAQKATDYPYYLIFNGRNDTRVNPAHSFKLAHALLDHGLQPDKVNLISIKNSGHWVTSIGYQTIIAWRAQTYLWTYIFDHLGMDVKL